jgi:glycosyltransferase involved in cell wall biosynthesis
VTLLTCDPADVPETWIANLECGDAMPAAVLIDPPGRVRAHWRGAALERLQRTIAAVDVLHLHTPWQRENVQLAAIANRLGKPYVLTPHGMLDDWSMAQKTLKKRVYLMLKGNRLLRGAARIHCTARGELDQASKWFDPTKGVVIPLLCDLEPFTKLTGPELAAKRFPAAASDAPRLLFLSRVHPKKGVEHLIHAAAHLNRLGRACTVLIAGPGDDDYLSSLRALARQLGVDERIHFLGMIRGEEKLSLYQAAQLFVLPTSQENFGLVLIEAMACGTPAMTTRGVDLWPELQEAGALIVEADGHAIATAVEPLLNDPQRLHILGQRGREWVFDQMAPKRVAREYEAMYRKVIEERASRA